MAVYPCLSCGEIATWKVTKYDGSFAGNAERYCDACVKSFLKDPYRYNCDTVVDHMAPPFEMFEYKSKGRGTDTWK